MRHIERTLKHSFIAGPPVTGGDFFGRRSEIETVVDCLNHGQSCLVTGERRIGKTSLLEQVDLLEESRYFNKVKFSGFGEHPGRIAERIYTQILDGAENKDKLPKGDWRRLVDYVLEDLRKENRHKPALIIFNDLDDAYRDTHIDTKGYTVSDVLRSLIETGSIICCATSYWDLMPSQREDFSLPLANVLREVSIGGFTPEEAMMFLEATSFKSGEKLSDSEIDYVISMAGTVPFHLQMFGIRLFEIDDFKGSEGANRLECIERASNDYFNELSRHWFYGFTRLNKEQRNLLQHVYDGNTPNDEFQERSLTQRGFFRGDNSEIHPFGTLHKEFISSIKEREGMDEKHRRAEDFYVDMAKEGIKSTIGAVIKGILA